MISEDGPPFARDQPAEVSVSALMSRHSATYHQCLPTVYRIASPIAIPMIPPINNPMSRERTYCLITRFREPVRHSALTSAQVFKDVLGLASFVGLGSADEKAASGSLEHGAGDFVGGSEEGAMAL